MSPGQRRSTWTLLTAIAVLGAIAVAGRFYYPHAALHWMLLHSVGDFHSFGDLWDFLARLRTAIPPVYATAEIIVHLLFGDILVPLAIAYYGSLLACFVIAVLLQRSTVERLVSLALSLLLAAGITSSHFVNPEPYDLYVPALAMLLLAFALVPPSHWAGWAAAGVILSMLELSRPFMLVGAAILAVPLLRLAVRRGRTALLALVVPVVLMSGGWHAKLLAVHGQLLISDHGAFNVVDGLSSVDFAVPVPSMEPESPAPAGGHWIDLNTDAHARNNAALSRALLAAIVNDPVGATKAVGQRLAEFFALPSTMYGRDFSAPILTPYRWLIRIGVPLSFLSFVTLAIRRGWLIIFEPVANFLLYSGFVLFCVAVCTAAEEMRLASEFAPTLALLPLFVRTASEPRGMRRSTRAEADPAEPARRRGAGDRGSVAG
jgi:hypothetical protein